MSRPQRQRLAYEAARLILGQGLRDWQRAKTKAAESLGLSSHNTPLPSNAEISEAIAAQQSLFGNAHSENMQKLQIDVAYEALKFLSNFGACAADGIIAGKLTPYDPVQIHVFAPKAEMVAVFLDDCDIDYEWHEKTLRFLPINHANAHETRACLSWWAGEVALEITVFGEHERQRLPYSPITGKIMQRANVQKFEMQFGL